MLTRLWHLHGMLLVTGVKGGVNCVRCEQGCSGASSTLTLHMALHPPALSHPRCVLGLCTLSAASAAAVLSSLSRQVLAIDEAQFFPDLVQFCQEAVDYHGKHVIVAGLSGQTGGGGAG